MIVIRVELWPDGDPTRAQTVAIGTLSLLGVRQDGERAYKLNLLKDPKHGGPDLPALPVDVDQAKLIAQPEASTVWQTRYVRGHVPGKRGVWDLLGGALSLLGERLKPYKGFNHKDVWSVPS